MLTPRSTNALSQIAHAPEQGACSSGIAAHLAGAGVSLRAEARAGIGEGFVDKDATADHRAVGEVADAMLQHACERDLAIALLFGGLIFGNTLARGFAHQRTIGSDALGSFFHRMRHQHFAVCA